MHRTFSQAASSAVLSKLRTMQELNGLSPRGTRPRTSSLVIAAGVQMMQGHLFGRPMPKEAVSQRSRAEAGTAGRDTRNGRDQARQ
jgi:predicted signal transduction protein with EAL and GGDEF domain